MNFNIQDSYIYSSRLSFRLGIRERGEGVYTEYMTEAERADNNAENSSVKTIKIVVLLLLIWFGMPITLISQPAVGGLQLPKELSNNNHFFKGALVLQLGLFESFGVFNPSTGKAQQGNIDDLIGDYYTVTNKSSGNVLAGLGYFIDGYNNKLFNLFYGIDAFYLAKTSVRGNIIQEGLFTNLSYSYNVTHIPIYAMAKTELNNGRNQYMITIDAGIGPNVIKTSHYNEMPLNNFSIPDNAYSGHTNAVFSTTAGIGLKINQAFGSVPLECGYRFFYLGQGRFRKDTNQLINALKTGNNYANALICSVML